MTLTIEIPAGVSVGFNSATGDAPELADDDAGPFGDTPIGPAGWLSIELLEAEPATAAILAQALEQAAEKIRAAGNPAPARPRGW